MKDGVNECESRWPWRLQDRVSDKEGANPGGNSDDDKANGNE